MNDEPKLTSEFNDAMGFLSHVQELFILLTEARCNKDAQRWWDLLQSLLMKLSNDMEKEEYWKLYDKLDELSSQVNRWNLNISKGKGSMDSKLYRELTIVEKRLNEIYNEAGYQKKVKDDPRFAR